MLRRCNIYGGDGREARNPRCIPRRRCADYTTLLEGNSERRAQAIEPIAGPASEEKLYLRIGRTANGNTLQSLCGQGTAHVLKLDNS
jgi:hypothetical protein